MNWRDFSKKLLLADGKIDRAKAALVRQAVVEDGRVDRKEVEFLLELRRDAKSVHPEFNKFLYRVLTRAVLKDGVISRSETAWLRKMIFDHGLLAGPQERLFLTELLRGARQVAPEFTVLLQECGGPLTAGVPTKKPATRLVR
jgi:hypothetical protein